MPPGKAVRARLSELADEYASRGVVFLAIDSNSQDSLAEMTHFVRNYKLTIPFLKDPGNVVADQFAAERTPEVFLLDQSRQVRYRGRIDDQYGFQSGVGYQRPKVQERTLVPAIDQLLAGKDVSEPTTRAPGCLIGRVIRPTKRPKSRSRSRSRDSFRNIASAATAKAKSLRSR